MSDNLSEKQLLVLELHRYSLRLQKCIDILKVAMTYKESGRVLENVRKYLQK